MAQVIALALLAVLNALHFASATLAPPGGWAADQCDGPDRVLRLATTVLSASGNLHYQQTKAHDDVARVVYSRDRRIDLPPVSVHLLC